jgi:hypothetical protein
MSSPESYERSTPEWQSPMDPSQMTRSDYCGDRRALLTARLGNEP